MVRSNLILRIFNTSRTFNVNDLINKQPTQVLPRSGSGRGNQKWIDSLRVHVKAGHGGNGHPKYGGIGGKGGDIIFQTSETGDTQESIRTVKKSNAKKLTQFTSLYDLFAREFRRDPSRQNVKATPGEDAHRNMLIGREGIHRILKVIFYSENIPQIKFENGELFTVMKGCRQVTHKISF